MEHKLKVITTKIRKRAGENEWSTNGESATNNLENKSLKIILDEPATNVVLNKRAEARGVQMVRQEHVEHDQKHNEHIFAGMVDHSG